MFLIANQMETKFLKVCKKGRDYVNFVIQYTWKESVDPARLLRPFVYSQFELVPISFTEYFGSYVGDMRYFYRFRFGGFCFDVASKSLLRLPLFFTKLGRSCIISSEIL